MITRLPQAMLISNSAPTATRVHHFVRPELLVEVSLEMGARDLASGNVDF